MGARRRKTARPNRGKQATVRRARASSAANLKERLDQRTRELAESQRQLAEALEQQTATTQILTSLSTSTNDAKPVFDAIVSNMLRLFRTQFTVVFLLRDEMLELAALKGNPEFEKRFVSAFPQPVNYATLTGQVLRTGKLIHLTPLIGNVESTPEVEQLARAFNYNSMMIVPMIHDGKTVGAIGTAHRDAIPFDDKQVALVKSFAAQAVIAIENARLLNELRESLDRQTATADILRVIAGTPEDSKRALDTIAETAVRMFDTANVNFRRLEGNVLRMVSSAGPSASRFREVLPDIPPEPTDPAVRSFLDNRQIAVEDRRATLANEHGEIARALRNLPIGSQAFTPLAREGKAIGVMIVNRSEVRPFQEYELELMKGFADQAVIAIENARLLNELRQSLEQQTATS